MTGNDVIPNGTICYTTQRHRIPQGLCIVDSSTVDAYGRITYTVSTLPLLGTKQKPKIRQYTIYELHPLRPRYEFLSEAVEMLDARIADAVSRGGVL